MILKKILTNKMWIVAKIKKDNFKIFKSKLLEKLSNINFYFPKIKGKTKDKNLLGNYIFCYHDSFIKENLRNSFNYTRGLEYFLNGSSSDQKELDNFINYCKKHEDNHGFIKNSFFKNRIDSNGRFTYGPFINSLFKIVGFKKNKLVVEIGNFKVNISDNESAIYQPS